MNVLKNLDEKAKKNLGKDGVYIFSELQGLLDTYLEDVRLSTIEFLRTGSTKGNFSVPSWLVSLVQIFGELAQHGKFINPNDKGYGSFLSSLFKDEIIPKTIFMDWDKATSAVFALCKKHGVDLDK